MMLRKRPRISWQDKCAAASSSSGDRPPHAGPREVDDLPCGGMPSSATLDAVLFSGLLAEGLDEETGALVGLVVAAYDALRVAQRLRRSHPRTWDPTTAHAAATSRTSKRTTDEMNDARRAGPLLIIFREPSRSRRHYMKS